MEGCPAALGEQLLLGVEGTRVGAVMLAVALDAEAWVPWGVLTGLDTCPQSRLPVLWAAEHAALWQARKHPGLCSHMSRQQGGQATLVGMLSWPARPWWCECRLLRAHSCPFCRELASAGKGSLELLLGAAPQPTSDPLTQGTKGRAPCQEWG